LRVTSFGGEELAMAINILIGVGAAYIRDGSRVLLRIAITEANGNRKLAIIYPFAISAFLWPSYGIYSGLWSRCFFWRDNAWTDKAKYLGI
jgi:hypothetical protein